MNTIGRNRSEEKNENTKRTDQVEQKEEKGETGKLVTAHPLIQTKAGGQFLLRLSA